jgi:ABC-type Mn2+/Zn2+ transport system ATPase subunit
MLARVLAGEPEALILDEPTSGVDSRTTEALYALLTGLNRERRLTILMVTHDVGRASAIASRVMCLEEGVAGGLPPQQVKEESSGTSTGIPPEGRTPWTFCSMILCAARFSWGCCWRSSCPAWAWWWS